MTLLSRLVEWTVLATTLLGVAWLATCVFRRTASLRHLIWTVALLSTLVIPVFTAVIPGRSVKPEPVIAPAELSANDLAALSIPDLPKVQEESPSPVPGLIWLVGTALFGFQIVIAAAGVRRLRSRSVSWLGDDIDPSALAIQLGVRRAWHLRQSCQSKPPAAMTWGVLHPVVLLPRDCFAWSIQRLRATVLHELAHIRRADSLTQQIARLACAIHWYNPAVWLAARAMRAEAEAAADDAVLRSGIKPSEYAAELLSLAAELGNLRQPAFSQGVSIMKDSRIEARIRAIVDPSRRRRGVTSLQALAAASVGLLIVAGMATLCPTAAASPVLDPPISGAAYQVPAASDKHSVENKTPDDRTRTLEVLAAERASGQQRKAAREEKTMAALQQKIAKLQAELAASNARLVQTQLQLARRTQRSNAQTDRAVSADMARKLEMEYAQRAANVSRMNSSVIKNQADMEKQIAELRQRAADAQLTGSDGAKRIAERQEMLQELAAKEKASSDQRVRELANDNDRFAAERALVDSKRAIEVQAAQNEEAIKLLNEHRAAELDARQRAAEIMARAKQIESQAAQYEARARKAMIAAEIAAARNRVMQDQAAKAKRLEEQKRQKAGGGKGAKKTSG